MNKSDLAQAPEEFCVKCGWAHYSRVGLTKTLPSRASWIQAVILEPACLGLDSDSTTYSYVALDKSLNLSVFLFFSRENGCDYSTYLIEVLKGLNMINILKCKLRVLLASLFLLSTSCIQPRVAVAQSG